MYIIGIIIGLYFKISIAFLCVILLVILAVWESCYLILNFKCIKNKFELKRCIKHSIFLLFILIGFLHVNILDKDYDAKYNKIYGEIILKGVIISESEDKDYKYTSTIKVEEINGDEKYKDTKLIVNINKNKINSIEPAFGDEIELKGEFIKPNGSRNYKGFNYKQYLKSKGVYGTVNVENYTIISKDKIDVFSKLINLVKNSMKNNINKILNKEEAALCIGILVGDREAISDETEDNFKNSNLTHMLAVSGSHITYIITALALLLGKIGKRFTKIITIIILLFFMALTGFTSSVIRACIMGILVLMASMLHRKSDTINNLGISSIIILFTNPYSIADVGFLLSYGGTIGIVLLGDKITNGIYKILKKITKNKLDIESKNNKFMYKVVKYIIISFSITLSANLIIIPIMAYNFSTVSFTFWISNILAAPVMEIVTIFGFIVYFVSIIFPLFAEFLGIFLNFLLSILLKIAEVSSNIIGSNVYIKTPYVIECVIYYLLIFILFEFKKFKVQIRVRAKKLAQKPICIVMLAIIIIGCIGTNFIPKSLRIYFVDVGQGDCTLIQTPTNKNILIDGGGSEFGTFDIGENTLLPYLLDRRITTIDYMIISHADSDHIAGLFAVIDNLKVKNIIISKQGKNSDNLKTLNELVNRNKINVKIVKSGDYIGVDKYTYFEILFPEEELIKENILNNNSIVAKFSYKNFSMLFTGDIEEIAEKKICQMYKGTNKLNAVILKVAHHGSKTSSTEEFLEIVKPNIALIGVGENNNFGHPNKEVLKRINQYTNLIYRTDECGEISLVITREGKIKVKKLIEDGNLE